MENKKTLWIVAAVGAFLLVVLGGALIMYSPSANSSHTIARVNPVEKTNNGWANPNPDANFKTDFDGNLPTASIEHQLQFPENNENQPLRTNEVYVVADKANVYELPSNTNGTTIDLNSLKNLKETTAEASAQNINVTVTIADKPSEAPAIRERLPRDFEKPASNKVAAAPKSDKAAPAVKKAETKAKAPATVAKAAPAAPSKFWVQVAAYSNKKGAETARQALGTNQIQADIFTYKDNKDNLFYRVRVGPYTTKSEAEYWRQKITKINEFSSAKSYVTSTN